MKILKVDINLVSEQYRKELLDSLNLSTHLWNRERVFIHILFNSLSRFISIFNDYSDQVINNTLDDINIEIQKPVRRKHLLYQAGKWSPVGSAPPSPSKEDGLHNVNLNKYAIYRFRRIMRSSMDFSVNVTSGSFGIDHTEVEIPARSGGFINQAFSMQILRLYNDPIQKMLSNEKMCELYYNSFSKLYLNILLEILHNIKYDENYSVQYGDIFRRDLMGDMLNDSLGSGPTDFDKMSTRQAEFNIQIGNFSKPADKKSIILY